MVTAVVISAVVLAAAWLWLPPNEPAANEPLTQEAVAAVLEMLLYRGLDGGSVTITVRDDPRTLTLVKYVRGPRAVGIRSEFPLEAWSEPFYEPFRTEFAIGVRLDTHCVAYFSKEVLTVDLPSLTGIARPGRR